MSYIDQTLLNDYQSEVVENEMRASEHGLISLAKKETARVPFLGDKLRTVINNHEGISVKVPALTESTITTTTSESFTIPTNLSESGMTTLTLGTIFCGYRIYPETFVNNVISEQEYRLNKIKEIDKAMANALEVVIDTHLNTYKSQVWETGGLNGFNFASNMLGVSLDEQNDVMFSNIKSQARINEWSSDISMAANFEIDFVLNQYRKYGAANDKNLQFQAIPSVFGSNNVTKTTGKRWTAYMVEPGALGLVENFKKPFAMGLNIGEATWGISDDALPRLGHRVMLFENKEKASAENVGTYGTGMIMSWVEEYGYIFRYCLLHKYNSSASTRVGYILKINGETT